MHEPYRMVFVSLTASFLLLAGILFYKFVYPKRSIPLFLLLIFISLLPVINIFRQGAYESGDFNIHVYRSMSFYDSLSEGNLMPSWAGDLNANYGYPLFIFNYPLPYYCISLLHFLGFSFIMSLKILLASTYILSGIFMYLLGKELFKNKLAAFTSSIFYLFTPYHLIDLNFKVGVGELLSFTVLPLTFLTLYKLYLKKNLQLILLSGIFLALFIMSHIVIALFASVIFIGYLLFLSKKTLRKHFSLHIFYPIPLALLISSYNWLGPLFLNHYTIVSTSTLKTVYFPTLLELLYSPWRMGFLFQGPNGEISTLIGYTQLLVVALLSFFLIKRSIPSKYKMGVLFWLLTFILLVFFITPYSKFLWEYSSFLKLIGSHRLLLIVALCVSILAGYLVLLFPKRKVLIYLLITITIGYTLLNWGHRAVISDISDSYFRTTLWKSTSEGEGHFYASPKWVDPKHLWFQSRPKAPIEVVTGTGDIKTLERNSTQHIYHASAETPLEIIENTLYFPGWEIKSNGKEIPINYTEKGLIKFVLPQGTQRVEIIYKDIFILKLLKTISALSLIGTFMFISLKLLRSYRL